MPKTGSRGTPTEYPARKDGRMPETAAGYEPIRMAGHVKT